MAPASGETTPEAADLPEVSEAPVSANALRSFLAYRHPPGYGGDPSSAPPGPYTYDTALQPGDVDCGDTAGMVLESAASAQLGAPAHAAAALIQRAYRASRARA